MAHQHRVFRRFVPAVLFLCFLSSTVYAQHAETSQTKYWIFLKDKAAPAAKVERAEISSRALERRNRRGSGYSNELDLFVSPLYLADLGRLGIEPVHQSRWLNAVSAFLTTEQVRAISSLSFVKNVRPVGRTHVNTPGLPHATSVPGMAASSLMSSPSRRLLDYGASEGQLQLVNAISNIEQGINGTGVRLGIIDTGLGDLTHPVLETMLNEGRFIESKDFTGLDDDGNRHALSVLSVAAGFSSGNLIGPAHAADILHARTEYAPTETNQEEDNFVAGLEWMESEGVDVVNISLGYSVFDEGEASYTYADMNGRTAVVTRAVAAAARLGVVVVSSAGNEGGCQPGFCWFYITAPADADTVITVGATDFSGVRASFSSHGPTSDGRTKPDISAQGVAVRLARSNGGFGSGNGTSFSSPMVAGIVAQILQVNPDLSPLEVRNLIRNTARVPGMEDQDPVTYPNNDLGWGIIDAGAAVAEATSITPESDLPSQLEVRGPYPNPATENVTFDVSTPVPVSEIRVEIYDLLGRRVSLKAVRSDQGWSSRLRFSTAKLVPGLYLYRFTSSEEMVSGTFAVVR